MSESYRTTLATNDELLVELASMEKDLRYWRSRAEDAERELRHVARRNWRPEGRLDAVREALDPKHDEERANAIPHGWTMDDRGRWIPVREGDK